MTTLAGLFADVLAANPSRPFITFYDDATGERAELSAASTANWVTKTHFLLTDELGLSAGDRALVDLPPHYLTAVVLLGAWSAGLEVVTAGSADVAFVGPSGSDTADADEVYALALEPWGRGFPGAAPAGTTDYVAAVRPHADAWAQVRPAAGPEHPALDGTIAAELVAAASERAGAAGLSTESRILLSYADDDAGIAADLLTVLVAGASMVLVRHATTPPAEDPRREQEHITHVL